MGSLPSLAELVDRDSEMDRLEARWQEVTAGAARLVLVTGRRQVGKTFLLAHARRRWQERGRTVSFTGLSGGSERQQLDALLAAVRSQLAEDDLLLPERLPDWSSALTWLARVATSEEPLAVVLDEIPYLLASSPTFGSVVQQFWDRLRELRRPPRLLLVLTGSSVATMRGLLGGDGVLYGRFDEELLVQPFDLPTAATVLSTLEPAEVVEAYAACGGYPLHLRAWDQRADAQDNLRRLVFTPGGLLLRNGSRLLADVPEGGAYQTTLHAIGSGEHRKTRIEEQTGQRIDRPLELLQRATLVRPDRPLGAPDRAASRWELTDIYLRAWYELCWADAESIEAGLGGPIQATRQQRWQRQVGWAFEELARAHAATLVAVGRLGPAETRIGRWWSSAGEQAEIDVLGLVAGRTALIGEVKWDARPIGTRLLEDLRTKERAAPRPVAQPLLALWSRGGATAGLLEAGVRSFTPADMVTVSPAAP